MPAYRYKRPRFGWGPREGWEYPNQAEQALAGWGLFDPNNHVGGIAAPAVDQFIEGAKAGKLIVINSAASSDVQLWRAFTGLVPSAIYTVRCWARHSSSAAAAKLGAQAGSSRPTFDTTHAGPINTWSQLSVSTAADAAGALAVSVGFTPPSGLGHQVWFDDLRLQLDIVLRDPLEQAVSYSEPRPDFEAFEFSSGVEDAWDAGENFFLAGAARWIPKDAGSGITGWDSSTGWAAFLAWARRKRVWDFYPDEADLLTYYRVVLTEPMKDRPGVEPNGTRRVDLAVKSADAIRLEGY